MAHPAIKSGNIAVITGGASGIGLASATKFAALGLRICIVDLGAERLQDAAGKISAAARGGATDILAVEADVSRPEELDRLAETVSARFGGTDILMNNAGIQPGSSMFGPVELWEEVLAVNLWGVIHGTRAFLPGMIARGAPGLVINTGSKQGITTPPGDPAYNISKAGVKVFTEALQHELRNTPGCTITAHLLIPGFVFTALTASGRSEKPPAAWTSDQTADFMLERVNAGDFYILCPDNDVPRTLDEKRILWAAQDIIENRPALSRWHKDFAAAFSSFVQRS